jgi:thiamine-monophosphate kinase
VDVRDLGEFGLIERLVGRQPSAPGAQLIVGPGDDAAVWRAGDASVIATTDTMVAGTHFLPERVAWRDAGWKALAANVSDIAAMGGTPAFALVTLCLPPDMAVAAMDELHEGLL